MKSMMGDRGNIAAIVLVCLAFVAVAGFSVWHFVSKKPAVQPTSVTHSTPKTSTNNNAPADPSEGGKYLVIKEWGVRATLPASLQGKVTYLLDESHNSKDPDTGLELASADIYVMTSAIPESECALEQTNLGTAVTTVTQYIRSNVSPPLNTSRYKGTFKQSVFQDDRYAYHLNYTIPDCIGAPSNRQKLLELQDSLTHLSKF